VERQIVDLVNMGIVKHSTSPMASPLVILKKKDGSHKLACDYRYIKSFTVGCQYPMPTVDEDIMNVGNANIISIFDCRSAYWTCPVVDTDQRKTAFITHHGLLEWTRVPFGMINS